MFTGIVQAVGEVRKVEPRGEDSRLYVATGELPLADVTIGDSIAVNGVCLTAVELDAAGFWADVSVESLRRSTLTDAGAGTRVNLEKALTPSTPLGGHLVTGHVDGVGEVIGRQAAGRSEVFRVRAPDALAKYIAEKGAICLDGVSLTVNTVSGSEFELNLVPHTLAATTLGDFRPGQRVNLEVDLIARYLERLLLGDAAARPPGPDLRTLLRDRGFRHA